MKKTILALIAATASFCQAGAAIKVVLPQDAPSDTIMMSAVSIADLVNAQRPSDLSYVTTKLIPQQGSATFSTPDVPSYCQITYKGDNQAVVYAAPGDDLTVTFTSLSPSAVEVKGTPLAEQMAALDAQIAPIEAEAMLIQSGQKQGDLNDLVAQYEKVFLDYATANPDTEATPYALMHIEDGRFLPLYEALGPVARASILMPVVDAMLPSVKARHEKELVQQRLMSGEVEAPAFTLRNLDGKEVSLSDFRGKWVVLDFWGSWCIWCIKGFPQLKEAYKEYDGKLEVIGIDCRETEEAWRRGVEKYALPWVNLYNPESETGIDKLYGVQGFPTKAIIDPEGKIRAIVTGENPRFFDTLRSLINGK